MDWCCCRNKQQELTDLLDQMQMAIFNHSVERVKKVLNSKDYPIDLIIDFSDKSTALLYAIKLDQPEICQILIQHGASINKLNQYGQTGLHLAVQYESVNCLNFLLQKKIYPFDIKNQEGDTVAKMIKKKGNISKDVLKILQQFNVS